jgi:hypothetical protein
MSLLAATSGPTLLWYISRGSGIAALIVLTLSMVLGLVTSARWTNPRWPRFVVELLHRNSSLVACALIVIHVAAVVLDGFAPIGWIDGVVPFLSPYRSVWLGLGTIGFDLVVALLATSLLRHRISHRTWRLVHWSAYLCWPLVVVHGLATGTDTKVGFVLILTIACVAAVIIALWWRLAVGWPDHAGIRLTALFTSVLAPVVMGWWLVDGPLANGWARRAGTPAAVLTRGGSQPPAGTAPTSTPGPTAAVPAAPFSARLTGTLTQSNPNADGQVTLRLVATVSGAASGALEIDLTGQPLQGGGLLLASSRASFGAAGQPPAYRGTVTSLRGQRIVATLRGASRPSIELTVDLQIPPAGDRVSGTVLAQQVGGVSDRTPGG